MWNKRLCLHPISKFVDNLRLHWNKHIHPDINEFDFLNFVFQLDNIDDSYNNFNVLELHEYALDHNHNHKLQHILHLYPK